MNGEEGKLIHDFDENEIIVKKSNAKKRFCRIFMAISALIIMVFIILIVRYFLTKKGNEGNGKEIEDKKEKQNDKAEKEMEEKFEDEKENIVEEEKVEIVEEEKEEIVEEEVEIEEEKIDNPYTLDTISEEELNNARISFYQEKFSDPGNPGKILPYNLFIPDIYSKNKKYPLIIFFGDESTIGNDTITPLYKTVGGPIWATEQFQKNHKCFVLIPQYTEIIINEDNKYVNNEFLNITIKLISEVQNKYNIDSNRIYGTGQSMGANIILYLLSHNQNLFTSSLIIDGHWIKEDLLSLINSSFTYLVTGGDGKSFKYQKEFKNYFNLSNITYGVITNLNAQEKVALLNKKLNMMYLNNYRHNFISYDNLTIIPSGLKGSNISFFKYGYRIESVKEWLFAQNKVKCYDGFYYSEFGNCVSTVPYQFQKKILLISNHSAGDILYDLLKKSPFISDVRIGSPNVTSEMKESFLSYFDCVIYDLQDYGYNVKLSDINAVKGYIINDGGSFLITHDHFDSSKYSSNILSLLGIQNEEENYMKKASNRSKIIKFEHPIFKSYYDLSNSRIINIAPSHRAYHSVPNKNKDKILMEFVTDENSGVINDYLVANEVGKGRMVYWSAGHSNYISEEEKALFINIISWLTKYN